MSDIKLIWEAYINILNENIEGRLAEHNAKEIFGSDDIPYVRGYIYQDGEYLNLRDGADHREINQAYYPDEETGLKEVDISSNNNLGSSKCMIHFMSEAGAIRWARTGNLLVMSYVRKPTHAQRRAVTKIIDRYNIESISIDVYSSRYETLKSFEGSVWDEEVDRFI